MQNSLNLAFLRIYYIMRPLNNQVLLILNINNMVYDSSSFIGFNSKFRRDELEEGRQLGIASNALDDQRAEEERISGKKEAHKNDVARRIEELGLKSGDRIVYNDVTGKKVLTIREIDSKTGKTTFVESKVTVSVFSPSLEKIDEGNVQ